jgi:hypothetical protein
MLVIEMRDEEFDEERQLLEVAERLRTGRKALSMTVYAVRHGRRTPEQVRAVLARSTVAIRRNQLVRTRWTQRLAVH